MRKRNQHDESGLALFTASVLMLMLVVLVNVLAFHIHAQSRQSKFFQYFRNSLYGAEYALSLSRAELAGGEDGNIGVEASAAIVGGELPGFGNEGVSPVSISGLPGIECYAVVENWGSDNRDNNGDGDVDEPGEMGLYRIRAVARNRRVVQGIEVILRAGAADGAFEQLSWRYINVSHLKPLGSD